MRASTSKDTKEYQFFIRAVINGQWERATELYERIPDTDFSAASHVLHYLIKQFKNEALERVLRDYRSLDVNVLDYKGKSPILVAFHVANEAAARLLKNYGANLRALDGHRNNIVSYAKVSKCRTMIDLGKEMLEDINPETADKKNFSDMAAKLLAKRNNGGITHYEPDFVK